MKRPVSLAIVLATAFCVPARAAPPGFYAPMPPAAAQTPHPAVVRVIVPDRDGGTSLGSGALVAVSAQHGLVVTCWHVVRDAAGPIVVAFPDGFRTGATLLRADRDWDLAALAIWRPKTAPIPLAARAPQPGEPLSIAGYGAGDYRMVAGRCTDYVSPSANHPAEMVELSAGARQGDSGGPILNGRGELAGVLFGTAWGETTGSYCGRVRWFLASAGDEFQHLAPGSIVVAQQTLPAATARGMSSPPASPSMLPTASMPGSACPSGVCPAAAGPAQGVVSVPAPSVASAPSTIAKTAAAPAEDGESLFDLARNVMAAIGVIAVFFHAMHLLIPKSS